MGTDRRNFLKEDPWRIILNMSYNLSSMEGHGAGSRSVSYVGSLYGSEAKNQIWEGKYVYDLYRDNLGKYWYETCVRIKNGNVISFEHYIFGRELKTKKRH
jgi:hypothetical protein